MSRSKIPAFSFPPPTRLKERTEILTKLKLKSGFFQFSSFIGILEEVCIITLREENHQYRCRMPMNQALLASIELLHNRVSHISLHSCPSRWEIPILQTELGNKGLEQPRNHRKLTLSLGQT